MNATQPLTTLLQMLHSFCSSRGISAWLVGGAARDLLLGRTPDDLDLAVDTDGWALARDLADTTGGAFVPLDDTRGTGRVVLPATAAEVVATPDTQTAPRVTIDLVQLRAPSIEEDLRLRDFTLNALAVPLPIPLSRTLTAADLLDPCGGLADLTARQLRPCLPTSLHDDPLRALRAFRLGATLPCSFVPELDTTLHAVAPLIRQVAAERVRDELLKLLATSATAPWLQHMDAVRLLTQIFPALEAARDCEQPLIHFLPVLGHLLESVACYEWLVAPLIPEATGAGGAPVAVQTYPDLPRLEAFQSELQTHFATSPGSGQRRVVLLKLAVLLHDIAKPATKAPKPGGGVTFYEHDVIGAEMARTIARELRLGRQAADYIGLIVRQHMRPGNLRSVPNLTPRAIAKFFRDTATAGPDVLLHALADHLAVRGPYLDRADWQHHLDWSAYLLSTQYEQPPERRLPLLNGHDLMQAFRLAPGKLVGHLLREVEEAQAAGEITTTDEALALVQRALKQHPDAR